VLVRDQFEWPAFVRLRRFRPPVGPAAATMLGGLLAVHLPLLGAYHILLRLVPMLLMMPAKSPSRLPR